MQGYATTNITALNANQMMLLCKEAFITNKEAYLNILWPLYIQCFHAPTLSIAPIHPPPCKHPPRPPPPPPRPTARHISLTVQLSLGI